jgi:8-oxo-dGTP pyrophosphatase MutT (NUDIX family)
VKFKAFKNKIAVLKTRKLGGLEEQFKLAPSLRLKYEISQIAAQNPKKAAVLALFYPNEHEQAVFILTKRASYKGTHSSQISFPGGKINIEDASLQETALRETFEEIGVSRKSVQVIRELTPIYIPPSNFLATPYIGCIDSTPKFKTNYEVANTIEVLVSDLLNDVSLSTVNITTSYMSNQDVPCFKLNGYVVWGATAMMLSEIKELLKY